jgi:hypothetical protein
VQRAAQAVQHVALLAKEELAHIMAEQVMVIMGTMVRLTIVN